MRKLVSFGLVVPVGLLVAACGGSAPSSKAVAGTATASDRSPGQVAAWVDEPVSFQAGGLTVYATYRHPVGYSKSVPGVLLIAGSGPTDRNGNTDLEPGPVNTLKTLANWLSQDGVASLRYDKLGSGETGLGPYAADLDAIGIGPFEQESLAALRFLAAQKGINDDRLAVFGHSEGALFALLLATGHAGSAPKVHALGLFEPLSIRYLDVITVQVDAQVAAQEKSGLISSALAETVDSTLRDAIARLRRTGTVPANLPYGLASLLNASTARFLYQADRYDPAVLAAALPAHTPVLVSCSNADIQVSCAEVNHLVAGLAKADASTDFVHLDGVDHVLKVDPSRSGAGYTKALPFSPQLRAALRSFVQEDL
jgi:hypothetical protein